MNLTLYVDVQKLIAARVNSAKFATTEDVVDATSKAQDQQEEFGDFEAGGLDNLLAEGECSIERDGSVDGEQAFRLRRAQQRKSL
jgi:hypothetical protein